MIINLDTCTEYIHQVLLNQILFWDREIIYDILDVNYEPLFYNKGVFSSRLSFL